VLRNEVLIMVIAIAPIVVAVFVMALLLVAGPHGTLALFALYGLYRLSVDVWNLMMPPHPRDMQTQSQTTYTYVSGQTREWFQPLKEREQGAWER
jgi:hypothetical protein